MIEHRSKYERFIRERGVGSRDKVADSVKSYLQYLEGVAKHLNITVDPRILGSKDDLEQLASMLRKSGKVSEKTVSNYPSAMAHYVDMVARMN